MCNARSLVMIAAMAVSAAVHAQPCPTDPNSRFTSFPGLESLHVIEQKEVTVQIVKHDFDAVKVSVNKATPLTIPLTRLTDDGVRQSFTITVGPAKSKAEVVIPQGPHEIIVSTYQGDVCTSQERLDAEGADSRVSAVIVGINDYKFMRDLKFAEQDARAFEQMLRKRIPEKDLTIRTLLGPEATKKKIEKALFDATRPASDQGTVMLYFSGHGLLIEDSNRFGAYLVPVDAESVQFPGDFIEHAFVIDGMRDMTLAKHRIVILDSCFSGLPLNGSETTEPSEFAKSITQIAAPNWLERARQDTRWTQIPPNVVWFSGSGPTQVSYEAPEFNHGLFTYYLLKAGEPTVSYSDLWTQINNAIQEYKKFKQSPELLGATSLSKTLHFPLTRDEE